ncbi:hypothetical protein JCM21714_4168 [Gracilibacillus boraciitolerans JCM 21714]|uniref:HTH merR-type domain-containing protein n=1 Tax=Gracilibacillus boraciitolerans JCM 21714 TaxID=1298598 RepID=W4VP40_9BACI|nr:hypothetical protein JCM21714_4168 [Gracilibacillus boraciitolerans JCM 21714]
MKHDIPDHMATFPISVVKDLTKLSGRQIRYYEEQRLISPARMKGIEECFRYRILND